MEPAQRTGSIHSGDNHLCTICYRSLLLLLSNGLQRFLHELLVFEAIHDTGLGYLLPEVRIETLFVTSEADTGLLDGVTLLIRQRTCQRPVRTYRTQLLAILGNDRGPVVGQAGDTGDLNLGLLRNDLTACGVLQIQHEVLVGTQQEATAFNTVAQCLGIVVTGLTATGATAGGVRLYGGGVDTWAFRGFPDLVVDQGLAVRINNRGGYLTTRHHRADTALTIDTEHRRFPTQVGAGLHDLAWALHAVGGRRRIRGQTGLGITVAGIDQPVGTLVALGVVDGDVTAVTLGNPVGVTGVALHVVLMLRDQEHGDLGQGRLEGALVADLLQQRNPEVQTVGGVDDNVLALLHHVTQGIAAGGQQEAVLGFVLGGVLHVLGPLLAETARLGVGGRQTVLHLTELFATTQGQIPGQFIEGTVAVFALDLDLSQGGAGDVAVTVQVDGGMAVLTEHAAFRIAGNRVHLMMQVFLDEQVALGVHLRLLLTLFIEGRAVRLFHDALIADTDALAAVVAGDAGLNRNTGVLDLAHLDLGLAGSLHAVGQDVARLVLLDGGIAAFVEAVIGVRHVTGGAAGTAVVTALVATGDANVTALAVVTGVGKTRMVGIVGQLGQIHLGQLFQPLGHLIRMFLDEVLHVLLVRLGADQGHRAVFVHDVVVAPDNLHVLLIAPGPHIALQLAGFGIHQGFVHTVVVSGVALTAGLVVDRHCPGIRQEVLGTTLFRKGGG